jgi:leucyl aminopeptidase
VDITFTTADALTLDADLLAVGIGSDLDGLDALTATLGEGLADYARASGFSGAAGTSLVIPGLGRTAATNVLLTGVGDGSPRARRQGAAQAGRQARALSARSLVLALGDSLDGRLAIEAVSAGNYDWDRFKREEARTPALETLTILGDGHVVDVEGSRIRAAWQGRARDLVNLPAADLYPESLADWAREHLGALEHVTVEVWDEDRLRAEDCVGILAVGQGSARRPRLIKASYRPEGAVDHVGLVGKGITFDAGGLSLKPTSGMQTMRCDMGGSATVLAAFGAAAEQGLPIALDVWVGAAENLLGGEAFKLGDILTYKNGVTVEIHNTDAEGRLVLADCLIRACEVEGVSHVVDAATLTGACVVAVGPDFTGLFTDDDGLATALVDAADAAGEGLWRLPLHAPYNQMLKGTWSQIKNVGGRAAGATTAALFLQHFVDGPAWAHLDIAGSSFHDKASGSYAAGATGEPVRSLVTWLEGRARG